MNSMTGYGYNENINDDFILSVQIKSYNNRFLEIFDNIDLNFNDSEAEINKRIKKVATRGHIEVNIKVNSLKSNIKLKVDEVALKEYKKTFDLINKTLEIPVQIQLSDLKTINGLITEVENKSSYLTQEILFSTFDGALEKFYNSRKIEGENTKVDLIAKLDELSQTVNYVKGMSGKLENKLKQLLLDRFDELLKDKEYDEGRFLQEVAVLLMKYTINEELVRLDSHLKEFYKLMQSKGPVGKKLDFLCQEMNREINTIGSKSNLIEISQSVVEMKNSLENIREQAKNIE